MATGENMAGETATGQLSAGEPTTGKRRRRRKSSSKNTAPLPTGYKVLLLFLLMLSLVLMYLSARLLMAGVNGVQVQMFLDDWMRRDAAPTDRAWQVAHQAAESAVRWSPAADGDAYGQLGRVNEWYRFGERFGSEEAKAARLAALEAYRAETRVRPLWPYGWTQLALVKLRLLDFDQEFHQALINARQHGGGRPRVHAQIAEISFMAWPYLSETEKQAAWESAEMTLRYLPRYTKSLVTLIESRGLTYPFCISVDHELLRQRNLCR